MMKVKLGHVIEIAGGLVVGGLVADALNGVIKVTKEAIKNSKKKGA